MQVLLANGNQLVTWAGLEGLVSLEELRMAGNRLGQGLKALQPLLTQQPSPPPQLMLPSLRVLQLDANRLEEVCGATMARQCRCLIKAQGVGHCWKLASVHGH